eukprot:6031734-Amphidinium_carterae.1
MEKRVTKTRAPGPGPLRSAEWEKIGTRFLSGKRVVIHTDSARAYEMPFSLVRRTRVIHQKKKVGGRWLKPKYTEEVEVETPDGTLTLMAGTQVIDGLWKHVRDGLNSINSNAECLDDIIRTVQWRYWCQGHEG